MVLEFIRVRLVHSCAPCGSLGSFGLVWSNGAPLVFVGFILVHSGVPLKSLVSFAFVWLRPGVRWVYSGSFGSFLRAVGVAGLI